MRSRASFTIGLTDLDGLLRTGESTLLNKGGYVYLCLLSDGIGGAGRGLSLPLVSYDKGYPTLGGLHPDPSNKSNCNILIRFNSSYVLNINIDILLQSFHPLEKSSN
jgi:hypothetical protein